MIQKIKTQKGFIPIPLLIAIIVSIVIASGIGIGVFFYKQELEKARLGTEELEQEAEWEEPKEEIITPQAVEPQSDEEAQRKIAELEQKIQEFEKKQQTITPEQQSSQSQDSRKEVQTDTLPELLMNEVMRRTVKIICKGSVFIDEGSGFIIGSGKVFTNAHVVLSGEIGTIICSIGQPLLPDYLPNKIHSSKYIGIASPIKEIPQTTEEIAKLFQILDFGFILLDKPTPEFGNISDLIPDCSLSKIKIGDKVNIFGYPNFGGGSLTVTDGIISGIENTKYGPIYKTSAKIDLGNSGGIAVNTTQKCLLGIPTWAKKGTFEGLGYIQSWEIIYNPAFGTVLISW